MEIVYYVENGNSPVAEFLTSLSVSIRARFNDYLNHLVDHQGRMQGVAFKKLHGYPMEEIRIKQSNNLHRVLIHVQIGDRILILHGFTKKEGESTPQKEIDIAYQRLKKMKQSSNI